MIGLNQVTDGYQKLMIARRIINHPALGIDKEEQAIFNDRLNVFEAILEKFTAYDSEKPLRDFFKKNYSVINPKDLDDFWDELKELQRIDQAEFKSPNLRNIVMGSGFTLHLFD